jgi:hypothetical protein
MNMTVEVLLVCIPASLDSQPVEGSQKDTCADCGTDIWVSVASKEVAGKDATLCCMSCATTRSGDDPNPQVMPMSQGQLEEFMQEIFGD